MIHFKKARAHESSVFVRADQIAAVVQMDERITMIHLIGGGQIEVAGFVDDVMGAVKAGLDDPRQPLVLHP